jgi:hypothetical protein
VRAGRGFSLEELKVSCFFIILILRLFFHVSLSSNLRRA